MRFERVWIRSRHLAGFLVFALAAGCLAACQSEPPVDVTGGHTGGAAGRAAHTGGTGGALDGGATGGTTPGGEGTGGTSEPRDAAAEAGSTGGTSTGGTAGSTAPGGRTGAAGTVGGEAGASGKPGSAGASGGGGQTPLGPVKFEKNVRVNDDSGSGMHTDRPRILCCIGSKGLRRLNIHSIEAQVGPLSRVSGSVLCVARSLRAFSLVMTPCHRRDSVPLATSSLSPSRWLRSRMPPVCRAPRPSRERAAVAPRPVVCQEAAPVAEASLGVEAPSGAAVSWGAAAPAVVGRGPPAPAA